MSDTPTDLKYIDTHQWARLESDGTVTVGITDYAQQQLGDVVYVELPEVGSTIALKAQVSTVESVKTASDVFTPISGEVIAINEALEDEPELVNDETYSKGWFFKVQPSDVSELDGLLDAEGYAAVIDD